MQHKTIYVTPRLSPKLTPPAVLASAVLIKSPLSTAPLSLAWFNASQGKMEIKPFAFLFANRGFILMFALDVLLTNVARVIIFF